MGRVAGGTIGYTLVAIQIANPDPGFQDQDRDFF